MNKNIFSYLFFNKKWVVAVVLLVLISALVAELVPFLQGQLVNKGIIPHNQESLVYLLIILGGALLLDAFSRAWLYVLANQIGFTAAQHIRTNFFGKLMRQPYPFFVHKRSGDMVFRANIYIYSIGNFLSKNLANLAIGAARVLIIVAYLFVLNYAFTLCLMGIYLIAIFFSIVHSRLTYKIGKAYKELELHRNSLILQNLDNMDTYLAYNDNFSYLKNYRRVDNKYHKARGRYHLAKHLFYPCIDFFVSLGTVVLYQLIFTSGFDVVMVGVAVAMLTYANRIITPIQLIAEGLAELVGTSAITNKIFNFVHKASKSKKIAFREKKFDIVCTNLSGQDESTGARFEKLNLTIPFGSHIAITGSYGNGKTAFAEMLLGLKGGETGSVTFNDVNVLEIRKTALNKVISLAGDDVGIFEGTLFENVHFAKPNCPQKEVITAIKNANLMDFANALLHGVHTKLKPETLSECTKQQIAFARVLLKNTPVIIIDEFDRDFDEKTKKHFFKTLKKFAKNKTLVYVCQGLPSELEFDKVINFNKYK